MCLHLEGIQAGKQLSLGTKWGSFLGQLPFSTRVDTEHSSYHSSLLDSKRVLGVSASVVALLVGVERLHDHEAVRRVDVLLVVGVVLVAAVGVGLAVSGGDVLVGSAVHLQKTAVLVPL